jgi:hypothetical protein
MNKAIVCLLFLFNFSLASADTINFDDLAGDFGPVPNSYKGLDWNSANLTGVVNVNPFLIPGVDYTGIKDNAFFNAYGYLSPTTTTIKTSDGGTFDFLSGFWTAGITGDVDIKFQGHLKDQLVFESSVYNLNSTSVTPVVLNWYGIDSLSIYSTAAVWTADNLEIDAHPSAVPLPAAVWLFVSGLLGLVGLRRKTI